jgi:hypothetical protein
LENWKRRSKELFKLFSEPSRNSTVSSAYCNKHIFSLPIFMPFTFLFCLIFYAEKQDHLGDSLFLFWKIVRICHFG